MSPMQILIIGSSITGPALASFLLLQPIAATDKPHITILERATALRTEGQNIDIRGSGVAIVRKLGLENEIRANLTGEAGVQWVDSKNHVKAQIDASPGGPTAELEITRGRLAEILVKRTQQISDTVRKQGGKGVKWIFGDYASAIEQDSDQAWVMLAKSGERLSFDLIVGADGLQSSTRKLVWGEEGEEKRVHKFGLYGAFFSMPVAKTDSNYRRWYHAEGRRGVMLRPNRLSNRTSCFMHIMTETDPRFDEVAVGSAGVKKQKTLVQEYMKDAGWECERILENMWETNDFYYDMIAQVKMEKWSKGRVVLIGDAAYCASPVSGMGTTLALNGAYHLAGQLLHDRNDFGVAFDKYEEKMKALVTQAQKLPRPKLKILFGTGTWWGVWLLNNIVGLLLLIGPVLKLLFRYLGPTAQQISVEDYGFEDCIMRRN